MEQSQDFLTNIQYKIEHNPYLQYPLKTHQKMSTPLQSQRVVLLGTLYKQEAGEGHEHSQLRIKGIYNQIIWFSYRKNFPILAPVHLQNTFISDTGWGCMIRVGQMMFAQVLQRRNGTAIGDQQQLRQLLNLFQDSQLDLLEAPFGIQQICRVANQEFMMLPGDWYKGTTITMVIQ